MLGFEYCAATAGTISGFQSQHQAKFCGVLATLPFDRQDEHENQLEQATVHLHLLESGFMTFWLRSFMLEQLSRNDKAEDVNE